MIGFAFLVFITGLFTDLYSFGYGVIGFFAVAILSVSFKSLFGIKDDNKEVKKMVNDILQTVNGWSNDE